MTTYICTTCFRTFSSLPLPFARAVTERSKCEVKTMAYLFIFVYLYMCVSYLVIFGTSTVPGTYEILNKCLWNEMWRKRMKKNMEERERMMWLEGEGSLVSMEMQKIVHIILCEEMSLTCVNIQFSHMCFVLSTKLQVLQREDLLNIGIRRCSLYYF